VSSILQDNAVVCLKELSGKILAAVILQRNPKYNIKLIKQEFFVYFFSCQKWKTKFQFIWSNCCLFFPRYGLRCLENLH